MSAKLDGFATFSNSSSELIVDMDLPKTGGDNGKKKLYQSHKTCFFHVRNQLIPLQTGISMRVL